MILGIHSIYRCTSSAYLVAALALLVFFFLTAAAEAGRIYEEVPIAHAIVGYDAVQKSPLLRRINLVVYGPDTLPIASKASGCAGIAIRPVQDLLDGVLFSSKKTLTEKLADKKTEKLAPAAPTD